MTLAKGDQLLIRRSGKILVDEASKDIVQVSGEAHHIFEVLDFSYLPTSAPDGRPLQMILVKVVK
jgi:hypothetical protein